MTCIEFAARTMDLPLLRAMLSCPEKMLPPAEEALKDVITRLYRHMPGGYMWLPLLVAKGLEMVP
jgi:hypothetical protein